MDTTSSPRALGGTLAALMLGLAGCAAPTPPLARGASEADAIARFGQPTARHALADGARRLEFARGPFERRTWMVDLDAGGRVSTVEQVLNEARFAQVRNGWTAQQLREFLGEPHRIQREYASKTTWYWRYPTYECLIAAATLNPRGLVQGGVSLMGDPACDATAD